MLLNKYKEIFFKYKPMLIFLQLLPSPNLCYMNFHRKAQNSKTKAFLGLTLCKKARYNLLLKF